MCACVCEYAVMERVVTQRLNVWASFKRWADRAGATAEGGLTIAAIVPPPCLEREGSAFSMGRGACIQSLPAANPGPMQYMVEEVVEVVVVVVGG